MLVSNKYKQLYECRLPAQAVRFHQDPVSEPDMQGYSGPGVPDLLKPMQTAPCLIKVDMASNSMSQWLTHWIKASTDTDLDISDYH